MSDDVKVNVKWMSIIMAIFALMSGVWFAASRVSAAETGCKTAQNGVAELKKNIYSELRYIRGRLDEIKGCGE